MRAGTTDANQDSVESYLAARVAEPHFRVFVSGTLPEKKHENCSEGTRPARDQHATRTRRRSGFFIFLFTTLVEQTNEQKTTAVIA